jgi:hypothetical protein
VRWRVFLQVDARGSAAELVELGDASVALGFLLRALGGSACAFELGCGWPGRSWAWRPAGRRPASTAAE